MTGATRQSTSGQVRRGESGTTRRVVGTRSSGERPGMSTRTDAASSRTFLPIHVQVVHVAALSYNSNVGNVRSGSTVRGTSTRSSSGSSGTVRSTSTRSSSTYNRGSSTAPRSYSNDNNRSSSSRSYSAPSPPGSVPMISYSSGSSCSRFWAVAYSSIHIANLSFFL